MLGFLKAFGMLFVLLFLLPVWLVRGVRARARFRAQLLQAGIPPAAARSMGNRYKLTLSDLGRLGSIARR